MDLSPALEPSTGTSVKKKKKQNKTEKFLTQTKSKLHEHELLLAQLVFRLNNLTTHKDKSLEEDNTAHKNIEEDNTAHKNIDNEDVKDDVGPWMALSECKK